MRWTACVLAVVLGGTLAACTHNPVSAHHPVSVHRTTTAAPPRTRGPAHIVVVVMENRSYAEIVHNRNAHFLNALLTKSATYSDFHAETHPSQPNYLALYSGSTHSVRSDACRYRFHSDNLGDEVLDAGLTFTAYTESMPVRGVVRCINLVSEYTRARQPGPTSATSQPR
jgi:acid phosphatase